MNVSRRSGGRLNSLGRSQASNTLLPASISLDEQEYSRRELYKIFAGAAFSKDTLHFKGFTNKLPSAPLPPYLEDERIDFKNAYPWLYPYVYTKGRASRLLAVNKWATPIAVSFGMPNNLEPFVDTSKNKIDYLYGDHIPAPTGAIKPEKLETVEKSIRSLVNELRKRTELQITYLPPSEETKANYAGIRIVLVPKNHFAKNMYKGSSYGSLSFNMTNVMPRVFRGSLYGTETRLVTAFVFSEGLEQQVDGYFLANGDNEIGMSFCYIWEGHPVDQLNGLIHECIIRSLGFPGVVDPAGPQPRKSALSFWNEPERWPARSKEKAKPPASVSDLDAFLIKTLYNPALKPGTDYREAAEILLRADE